MAKEVNQEVKEQVNKAPKTVEDKLKEALEINQNLIQQTEMFKQQYQQLYNEYQRVSNEAFYKRMEFNFKVIENSGYFSPEFVLKIQKEIEMVMSEPEKKEEEKAE